MNAADTAYLVLFLALLVGASVPLGLWIAGVLRGDPPGCSGRQGRTVAYTVTPLAIDLFPELARLVETAISSRPPARDDAPDA